MAEARKFVTTRRLEAAPQASDFRLETERLPALKDGQILCESVYLSVDPYQRLAVQWQPVGTTMPGPQLSRIVESRAPEYPVGRYVVGYWGWRDRTVVNVAETDKDFLPPMLVTEYEDMPLTYSLSVLGMPGATAYFGLLHICDPKPGEVVVVSGAAGAVGSIVGQIARIKGCKVIGIAGSDAKVKWLKEELGFHEAINYKTADVQKALGAAAPGGVDVYFDNVGGAQAHAVLTNMKLHGRVSICGAVSSYNDQDEVMMAPVVQGPVLGKQLKMEGFMVHRWWGRWDEAFVEIARWIREGQLKYKETLTEGFENTPKAFIGLLKGENFGKAVVKV